RPPTAACHGRTRGGNPARSHQQPARALGDATPTRRLPDGNHSPRLRQQTARVPAHGAGGVGDKQQRATSRLSGARPPSFGRVAREISNAKEGPSNTYQVTRCHAANTPPASRRNLPCSPRPPRPLRCKRSTIVFRF